MKCHLDLNDRNSKCDRCVRKSLDCVFREHRRGRKPGTRISRGRPALGTHKEVLPRPKNGASEEHMLSEDVPQPASVTQEALPVVEDGSLQPSGLLNREAMAGKFSLRCILGTAESDGAGAASQGDLPPIPTDDPIRLGFVNLSMAKYLFNNFLTVLNPYICQLDPLLHTFVYVRQKSPFLFTAVLSMAAKAFDTSLYAQLHEHAENLLCVGFRRGTKSTEIAQAILILTYWKEPQDTRAWTLLGYVIRMCMDLGWHKLERPLGREHNAVDDTEQREARNVERTWYVIFVYDRSISLQTGKPYMIERTDFIESIEAWCKSSICTPNDYLLGALVKLRLETSGTFKLLGLRQGQREGPAVHNVESLLTLIHGRIHEWEGRWLLATEAAVPVEEDNCHSFLVRFYGTHLRLQLFSLPLQDILASRGLESPSSLEMLWIAYSSAMDLLQLTLRHSSQLYFAQDSIHVMIAYGAAFLVKVRPQSVLSLQSHTNNTAKLLLLAPESMVAKIESPAIDAIRNAARAFSQQAAPLGSSCALQAGFLNKIASNFVAERSPATQDAAADFIGGASQDNSQDPSTKTTSLRYDFSRTMFEPADPIFHQGNLDLQLADDETWANMFASAGFDTQDGVFLA
ncbi:hypothetical protein G7046_g5725 [Stylonectria norvegica]|nr:hypothetical protein G7046_g5725 [Stylonectria norvegica]